jgi:tetratricopeptide (TPR) repeat protein
VHERVGVARTGEEGRLSNTSQARAAQAEYDLGISMLDGPSAPGELRENMERGLVALINARGYFTCDAYPEKWVEITERLGLLFLSRREGGKSENLRDGIHYLEEASIQYEHMHNPLMWAKCQSKLGSALVKLGASKDPALKERALRHFDAALRVITKENWPEVWHNIHLDLHFLYQALGTDPDGVYQKVAEDHARAALDIDRREYPELYNCLARLKELNSRRLELRRELIELREIKGRQEGDKR